MKVREWSNLRIAFGTFIGITSGFGFIRFQSRRNTTASTIAEANIVITRSFFFPPLSSTIDYLSTETFQFHVESTVWDYWKEDLLTMFCYFAPVIRHSVQTMCTMFSRTDVFRLFGGLLRISTRKTNAEPRCLTSSDGHDGAICAAKHLELVHAHHLANPYTDLTNSIWGTKY